MKEFKELEKEKWLRIEVCEVGHGSVLWGVCANKVGQLVDENIRNWKVGLYVLNPSSLYYGGYFQVSGLKILCFYHLPPQPDGKLQERGKLTKRWKL